MEIKTISRRRATGLAAATLLTGVFPQPSQAAWPLVIRGLGGLARLFFGRIGAKEVIASAVTTLAKRTFARTIAISTPGSFAHRSANLALNGVKAYEVFSAVSDAVSDTFYVLELLDDSGDLKFPLLKESSLVSDSDGVDISTDVYVTAEPLLLAILGNESNALELVYEKSRDEGRAVPESLEVYLRDMLFPISFKTFDSFGFDRGVECEFQSKYGDLRLTYNSTWTEKDVSGKYVIEVKMGNELYGPFEREYRFMSA